MSLAPPGPRAQCLSLSLAILNLSVGLMACPGHLQGLPCMTASRSTCSLRTSSRRTATPSRTPRGQGALSSSPPRRSHPKTVSCLLPLHSF